MTQKTCFYLFWVTRWNSCRRPWVTITNHYLHFSNRSQSDAHEGHRSPPILSCSAHHGECFCANRPSISSLYLSQSVVEKFYANRVDSKNLNSRHFFVAIFCVKPWSKIQKYDQNILKGFSINQKINFWKKLSKNIICQWSVKALLTSYLYSALGQNRGSTTPCYKYRRGRIGVLQLPRLYL